MNKKKPIRIQRKRTKGWKMPPNKKCRICGKTLDEQNIYLSRIKKQDWICKKCHRKTTYKKWWNSLSDKQKKEYRKIANLSRRGLTIEDVERMKKEQGYKCLICKTRFAKVKKLINQFGKYDFVIDHNHEDGKVRALLCHECNSMLGYSKDNPEILRSGAKYLEKYDKS